MMEAIKIQKRKKKTDKLIPGVPGKSDKPWKTLLVLGKWCVKDQELHDESSKGT